MAAKILANFTRHFPGGTRIDIRGLRIDGAQSPITVLFGASGAGKTTVLRCLAGLERPDAGEITCNDVPWFNGKQQIILQPQKRHVGYLSQDFALFPHLTAEANVAYGLRTLEASEREARVSEVLKLFEIGALAKRLPQELSGGQQQRLALARAVVRRPQLLLLDEPLSALDQPTRVRLRGELRRWLLKLQIPALVVTHDRIEAMALGDYLLVLHDGQIAQAGTPAEVFNRPANLDVASILAIETIQAGRMVSADAGLLTVEAGRAKLVAVDETGQKISAAVHVCIRAEDVIVVKGTSGPSSARNHLPAIIQTITPEGPLMRVELDCGFPLTAVLTRQACETLALAVGDSVVALIKAPHIHLLPRSE